MDRRVAVLVVVSVHLAVAVAHGATHGLHRVHLSAGTNLLVVLTTFVGPVGGAVLARRDHPVGIPLFTLSMAGALALGGALHFAVENPDHVAVLSGGPWRLPFVASAVGVACTATAGVVVGAWAWRSP